MKKILYLISFLLIVIILIILILLIRVKNNTEENTNNNDYMKDNLSISNEEYTRFKKIENRNYYILVKNIVDKYFLYVTELNGDAYINKSEIKNFDEYIENLKETSINYFNSVLDKKYKNQFNINKTAIVAEASKYCKNGKYNISDINYNIIINDIYQINLNDQFVLFYAIILVENKELNMLIKYDGNNQIYSIFLEDYIDKNNIVLNERVYDSTSYLDKLEKNTYNSIYKINFSDEDISREYLNIQKNYLLNNIEKEYNLLDEEYKKKRFPTKENFNDYVLNIKESLSDIRLAKYSVKKEQNKIIYNLVDNYGRYYIIETKDSVLDYTVKLDDYTILNDEYINLYSNADNDNKVVSNAQLFIKMLNNKDYKALYNHLDNTFKDNNFPTEQSFINYLKKNFYNYNEIVSIDEVKNEGSYYIVNFTIKNLVDKSSKEVQRMCIIALNNGTDFTMSLGM